MPRKKPTVIDEIDPNGMFAGMIVFFVNDEVQSSRLQIWKQKLIQRGARIEERLSKSVTHVFATNSKALLQRFDRERLERYKGSVLAYQWLEDSLRAGEKVSEDLYHLELMSLEEEKSTGKVSNSVAPWKRIKSSSGEGGDARADGTLEGGVNAVSQEPDSPKSFDSYSSKSMGTYSPKNLNSPSSDVSSVYSPPDLNRNITEIFGKLINIYRALGDDRRSFSYHKVIPVIEKLPFKIENSEQVKNLPGIGKSMQDHIQEIVSTGKLSKLEHFETDEKVRTISLFGEVWGIGPATALKLYEKGHNTLDDLKNEESLTYAQKMGLKYFDDINTRIPRHEVQVMEELLKKVGEEILPGVEIVCGGSYRRGKATCGDMDIVITHPDRKSHKGFLSKFVKRLKDMNFLREDLIFSTHSEEFGENELFTSIDYLLLLWEAGNYIVWYYISSENLKGTDSGVDTYFGLCTYPGRELRHRTDFKVYPRDIYAFGLIAWTGNDVLNRRLRLLADSKGFRLDDTGLFPATQSSGGKRGTKATASLKFDTEKEVFDFLGFPWLEPHERNL